MIMAAFLVKTAFLFFALSSPVFDKEALVWYYQRCKTAFSAKPKTLSVM